MLHNKYIVVLMAFNVMINGYINTMRPPVNYTLKSSVMWWANGSRRLEVLSQSSSVSSRIKATRSFATSGKTNLHIQDDLNPLKYRCDKLKSRKSKHLPHLTCLLHLCLSRVFFIYEIYLRTTRKLITFLCTKCATN